MHSQGEKGGMYYESRGERFSYLFYLFAARSDEFPSLVGFYPEDVDEVFDTVYDKINN